MYKCSPSPHDLAIDGYSIDHTDLYNLDSKGNEVVVVEQVRISSALFLNPIDRADARSSLTGILLSFRRARLPSM
jgi:hypothetical protein